MRKSYYMHFRVPHERLADQPSAKGGVTLLVFHNEGGELPDRPLTWIVTRASCSPFEIFSRKRGRSIAEDRAIAGEAEAMSVSEQPSREQLIEYAEDCWQAAWHHSMTLHAAPMLRQLAALGFDLSAVEPPPCPELILRPRRGREPKET